MPSRPKNLAAPCVGPAEFMLRGWTRHEGKKVAYYREHGGLVADVFETRMRDGVIWSWEVHDSDDRRLTGGGSEYLEVSLRKAGEYMNKHGRK